MSSGFIKESEIEEARKKRQEEWEKVRQEDDPETAPEEEYDPRSLFERLQEQKQKKDLEFEESRKLKNMIRGLDDDEVEYLEYVDKIKLDKDRKTVEEERNEIRDFREKVEELKQKSLDEKLQLEMLKPKQKPKTDVPNRFSQKSLLASGIKRKSTTQTETEQPNKKLVTATSNSTNDKVPANTEKSKSSLKVVGILPGLISYEDSSEDSDDSDSDSPESENDKNPKCDWIGRKIKKKGDDDDSSSDD